MAKIRGWERGQRMMARLPPWLQVIVAPWFAWLEIIVPRPRVVIAVGVAGAAFLVALQRYYGVNELSWGEITALATAHVWFPLLVMAPVLLPFVLGGFLLWTVVTRMQERHTRS
jgi:hypothetical protein